VTEESLATFFADCGTVMDCRICGDPNSAMRFAFIEFLEEAGAQEVRLPHPATVAAVNNAACSPMLC
jgi:RNA recognition motif-containing protein